MKGIVFSQTNVIIDFVPSLLWLSFINFWMSTEPGLHNDIFNFDFEMNTCICFICTPCTYNHIFYIRQTKALSVLKIKNWAPVLALKAMGIYF